VRTGVALGSNVGDRLANLRAARKAIVDLIRHGTDAPRRAGIAPPILASAVYETEPVDCELGAGKFLNAVLEFEYDGDAIDLLEKLKQIEAAMGRPANHARNTSRNIDIDLLYFGDTKIDPPPPGSGAADNERLQLPHPRMHLRRFVLQPLADIRPDLILPGQAKSVRDLLAQVDDPGKVVRLEENW
jgi:2-amino-4-hydroxy-6-hydroxymethyldihydropteridine diphosphokinase